MYVYIGWLDFVYNSDKTQEDLLKIWRNGLNEVGLIKRSYSRLYRAVNYNFSNFFEGERLIYKGTEVLGENGGTSGIKVQFSNEDNKILEGSVLEPKQSYELFTNPTSSNFNSNIFAVVDNKLKVISGLDNIKVVFTDKFDFKNSRPEKTYKSLME